MFDGIVLAIISPLLDTNLYFPRAYTTHLRNVWLLEKILEITEDDISGDTFEVSVTRLTEISKDLPWPAMGNCFK